MLKIKDDVDLQRLIDEFGFEFNKDKSYINIENEWFSLMRFETKTRKMIQFREDLFKHGTKQYECNPNSFALLYNLIKAGLVEKVGE